MQNNSEKRDGETEKGFEIDTSDPLARLKALDRFVVGQLGQSLDGRIATHTGHSKYINHTCGLTHLHGLRAAVDAVIVGVGTVNSDDPSLTVRLADGKSPVRVIIDPNGRAFKDLSLFADDGPDVIIITRESVQHPMDEQHKVIALPDKAGRLAPEAIVTCLNDMGLKRLLVEGGSRTLSAFMDAGCVDRLHLIVSPVLLGSGYSGLNLSAIGHVDSALKPDIRLHHLGHDLLFDCALK